MTVIPSFTREPLNTNADSTDTIGSGWSWINEPVGISKADAFNKLGLLEQINTTADKSDYLWYSLRYPGVLILNLFPEGIIAIHSYFLFHNILMNFVECFWQNGYQRR